MPKPDYAHKWTDKQLAALEKRIAAEFKQAADELTATVNAYFAAFVKRDAEMAAKAEAGEITEQAYKQWRLAQIGRGKRFEALRDKVAERYTNAHEVAIAYVNDSTPGIYTLNRNYSAYTIEQISDKADFTLWDEQTVRRLIDEQPGLMPYYPPKRALKRGIDLDYGKKQITASITSSILQGKGIDKISIDLQNRMQGMSLASAIRTARTATTAAQNAGRMDSYHAAEGMGIKLKKEWLATLDGRTRHAHAMLDGQTAETDKPFHVDGYEIMYPGDTSAPGYLVYNCRCTLIAALDDVPKTPNPLRWARDPETGKSILVSDMTYAQWVSWKAAKNKVANGNKSVTLESKKPLVYRQFDTGDAANDFFYYDGQERGLLAKNKSKQKLWEKSLSESEDYAIEDYTGGGYYDINEYLRKTGDWESINAAYVIQQIEGLDSAISRYELKDNIRVQRGVMNDVIDRLAEQHDVQNSLSELVGKKYVESGYSSTTALQGNRVATAKPTILDIEVPAGVGRGAYVNRLAGQFQDTEYEFLIKRGASFTIEEVIEEEVMGEYHYRVKLVMDVE